MNKARIESKAGSDSKVTPGEASPSKVTVESGDMTLVCYRGDAKTLLAFDLKGLAARTHLAGFTIQVTPPSVKLPGVKPYYILNDLRFETPADHAQDPAESPFSSVNAPIHKFRWLHVPGSAHQGLTPVAGRYIYTVTPRYFDSHGRMLPLEPARSLSAAIEVDSFVKGGIALGFTRGFTQSQAFVRHFGAKATIRPQTTDLLFDTSKPSGTNAAGESYTYAQEYDWLGFTARRRIFALLQAVRGDPGLQLDVFAYDLNEPDLMELLLQIGKAGRARLILDNSSLHHDKSASKPEDEFATLFAKQAGDDRIKRGKFGRYAHDKVFIVSDATGPKQVLTGSTNFSLTGLYVNSNHVLVIDDADVAKAYAGVFEEAWNDDVHAAAFANSPWAAQTFSFGGAELPKTDITFSPHHADEANRIVEGIVTRIDQEGQVKGGKGSVLFAVMTLDGGATNPVYAALNKIHENGRIFSYGISDSPDGISLYPLGKTTGVLVTGKPLNTVLPPPFDQVPGVSEFGAQHQVHHKFIVCGFNGADPVVYCGSSNLALKGEQVNGDNLLAIHDGDIATVFAIEALALVDHFDFLDRLATGPKGKGAGGGGGPAKAAAVKQQAAESAGWFLATDDSWVHKYFDPHDLHCVDRMLFAE